MSKRIIRCCGPALLLVTAILLLGTGTALGVTTGLAIQKSCPATVQQGETFTCTFQITNQNPDNTGVPPLGQLNNLDVCNTVPFVAPGPGPGTQVCNIDCTQAGVPVTTLAPMGQALDTCIGSISETAPIDCHQTGEPTFTDKLEAFGTYTDGNATSGSTTVAPKVEPVNCNDNQFCTDDSCDPTIPITDSTNPGASLCVHSAHACTDNNLCTTDVCDPTAAGGAGACAFTPVVCNDNNLCTTDACDPTTGNCIFTPKVCNDNNLCTADSCDPTTGNCVNTQKDCNDNNPCTDDSCDPSTGNCVNTPNNNPGCVTNEICRTPGFWGTHACPETKTGLECTLAGSVCEKANSQNITGIVLGDFTGACGPLVICGQDITNTCLNGESTTEAICVHIKGDSSLQVARQLTAAALNCILSNSTDTTAGTCTGAGENCADPCAGVSIDPIFTACNDPANLCSATVTIGTDTFSCIDALDCFNGGGTFTTANGGSCAATEGTSCHDRDLVNGCFSFNPPGPAGSPKECNDANKDDITIF